MDPFSTSVAERSKGRGPRQYLRARIDRGMTRFPRACFPGCSIVAAGRLQTQIVFGIGPVDPDKGSKLFFI